MIMAVAACGGTVVEQPAENSEQTGEELTSWLESETYKDIGNTIVESNQDGVISNDGETEPVVEANTTANTPITEAPQAADATGIPIGFTEDGRPYRGDPQAPIVIEEFSDYQCPYCARFFAQTLPSLLENQIRAGEVVLIYYDFPLYSIHPQAEAAANAARCAGEQGIESYWEYHDLLFRRSNEWIGTNPQAVFIRFGEEIGLAETDFAECVTDGRHIEAVTVDYELGIRRGVSSTPSFFLNEQPLIGAQPLQTFNQAITALLNGEEIAAAHSGAEPQEIVIPTPAAIPLDAEDVAFAMGDPDAPVQIVEYTDYQCPFCQQHSQQTLPLIISEMVDNGRVYYVIKDFPLDSLHPDARAAAKAVRCGGEQDAYLEMHDAIFNNTDRWVGQVAGTGEVFAELATEVGLDVAAFNSCYSGNEQDRLIQANYEEGQRLGVNSTPSFFFNGYLASGALPFENFEQIITWAENGELADVVEASIRQAYARQQAQQQPQPPPTPAGPVDVPIAGSYAIGDPAAPVIIVEYTDYQCPYCGRHFAQSFPDLKEKYVDTGQIYYVFKDFPLTSIHPQAMLAAEAARCAGDQDAYPEMHDLLFANQNEWNGRDDAAAIFSGYAAELGLNRATFDQCLESHQHEAAITADLNEGLGFGVQGTPTFFLNGQRLVGAQPLQVFEQAILSLTNSVEE